MLAVLAALAAVALGSPPLPAEAQQALRVRLHDKAVVSKVRLTLDKSLTVRLDRNVSEALVANQEIADVVPLTAQSIYIVGKKIGLTRLTLLDDQKGLLGIVEIEVSYDVDALQQELKRNVPGGQFSIPLVIRMATRTGGCSQPCSIE